MVRVFGPPGKIRSSKNKSNTANNNSNPKENPLLNTADGSNGNGNGNDDQNSRSGIYRPARPKVGCCGHLLILSLPMLAMAFTLAFLIALLVFDRDQIQQVEMNGDEDAYGVVNSYYGSISEDTVSFIMSEYEPFWELIALSSIACLLVSLVTVARNIQIEVYHKRTQSIICMKFVNYIAAIVNILSYIGLIVAVAFKVTQEDPSWAIPAHFVGASTFFVGTAIYAMLHSFLLWNQSQYPIVVKILFTIFAIVIVICSLAFGIPILLDGLSDEGTQPIFEWVAIFMTAINTGFYAILFHIDPVDDELSAFFCRR